MEHDFYHLYEAAKLLECEENDLLKWGASGKIDLCVWYEGHLDIFFLSEEDFTGRPAPRKNETVMAFLPIVKEDIMRFFIPGVSRSNGNMYIDRLMWPGCDSPLCPIWVDDEWRPRYLEPTKNDLFIMRETFDTLKAELHKSPLELVAPSFVDSEMVKILDPLHPWHSELLAFAVQAWLELYSEREGKRNDNQYNPPGGHIAMIQKLLSQKKSNLLTQTSIEYLGKVINPCKAGGPNKMQE
jgi:hypothetical protein